MHLDGHTDQRFLAALPPAPQPRLLPADVGLVDFHPTREPFAAGAHQH
jgi:hypothetical protein